jgi:hypothetical protein
MKFNYLLFILTSSYLSFSSCFTLHINNHYSTIAGKICNLNSIFNEGFYNNDNTNYFFNTYDIKFYNNNKSILLELNDKNNIKYLLKDKYNYLIKFDIFKYKYNVMVKAIPISYNYTKLDIDIRQNRNSKYNTTHLNFNHYRRIDNIIYKYIYNNIILKNKEEMSIELFRFFNNY